MPIISTKQMDSIATKLKTSVPDLIPDLEAVRTHAEKAQIVSNKIKELKDADPPLTKELLEDIIVYTLGVIEGLFDKENSARRKSVSTATASAVEINTQQRQRTRTGSVISLWTSTMKGADGIAKAVAALANAEFITSPNESMHLKDTSSTIDELVVKFDAVLNARTDYKEAIPERKDPAKPKLERRMSKSNGLDVIPELDSTQQIIEHPGATLGMQNLSFDLNSLVVKRPTHTDSEVSDFQPDASGNPDRPGEDSSEMISHPVDFGNEEAANATAVIIHTPGVDAERVLARTAKVSARIKVHERMFSALATATNINPKNVLNAVMSKYTDNLAFYEENDRKRKSKSTTDAEDLKDITHIYLKTLWTYDDSSLHITAKNPNSPEDFDVAVATLHLKPDLAVMYVESEAVKPVTGDRASNVQTAGSTTQEALMQACAAIRNQSNIDTTFVDVFTPRKNDGTRVRNPQNVNVENIVNTCMVTVLPARCIPTFDQITLKKLAEHVQNNPNTDLSEKIELIFSIQAVAKSQKPADVLQALQKYDTYVSNKSSSKRVKAHVHKGQERISDITSKYRR